METTLKNFLIAIGIFILSFFLFSGETQAKYVQETSVGSFDLVVNMEKSYTINFVDQDGTATTITVDETSETISVPEAAEMDGYDFYGWVYEDIVLDTTISYEDLKSYGLIFGEYSFYATYTISCDEEVVIDEDGSYSVYIRYNSDDETYVVKYVIDEDTTTDPISFTNTGFTAADGYNFSGWAEEEDGDVIETLSLLTENHETITDLYAVYTINMLEAGSSLYSSGTFSSSLTAVVFGSTDDYSEIVEDYEGEDVSLYQDGNILYYEVDTTGYILSDTLIYLNENCQSMFRNKKSLTTITFDNVDTQYVTTFYQAFYSCSALTSIDFSGLDTSNIETMYQAFYYCSNLESVTFDDLSSVTNLNYAFYNCSSLSSINLSDWDLSCIESLYYTFYGCSLIESADLSSWDTSNLTTLYGTFYDCESLTSINLEGWNVENLTTMQRIFYGCESLTSLDFSTWENTGGVTSLNYAFRDCSSLITIDLSNFDASGLTNIGYAFMNCTSLTTIYATTDLYTSNCTSYSYTFRYCSALVGGNGTSYADNGTYTGIMAIIDNDDQEGYLTDSSGISTSSLIEDDDEEGVAASSLDDEEEDDSFVLTEIIEGDDDEDSFVLTEIIEGEETSVDEDDEEESTATSSLTEIIEGDTEEDEDDEEVTASSLTEIIESEEAAASSSINTEDTADNTEEDTIDEIIESDTNDENDDKEDETVTDETVEITEDKDTITEIIE